MSTVTCPDCGTRYRYSAAAAGKHIRCRRCEARIQIPAAPPPAEPGPAENSGGGAASVRCACEHCGAVLKVPARALGRRVKCPKCGQATPIDPTPRAAPAAVAAAAVPVGAPPAVADEDDGLYQLLDFEKSAPAVARPKPPAVEIREDAKLTGPTCPGCRQRQPEGAQVCVQCGISLKTGRPILMTQNENFDQIYSFAEGILQYASWICWFGIYPIASEAFGMAKPWVIRAVVIVTILTSLAYLPFVYTDPEAEGEAAKFMLWAGDPAWARREIATLRSAAAEEEWIVHKHMLEEAADEMEEYLQMAYAFQPFQLLTHAFLHGGLVHLIGNMIFLLVFGTRVNALVGNLWMLFLYPLLAVLAGAIYAFSQENSFPHPMLGASGAVMGLAGMYVVLFPAHRVHMACWWRWWFLWSYRLLLVRGFWVVLFYIAFDVLYTSIGLETGVAHWAHLGGFIAGVALALLMLVTHMVNARGGDLLTVLLGRRAWVIVGRPWK